MVAGGWVDDHAWRFVHHDQVRIVVDDRQWDWFRSRIQKLDLRQLVLDKVASSNGFGRARLTAVQQDTPRPHQPSGSGAAELRLQLSQSPVEPGV